MAAKKYGTTWWGKQWLNALENIDYSNRLPRGRTYANKGAVKEISIEKEGIFAKVQGSRRTPYKQEIRLKQFSTTEKLGIMALISENPFILSALLNKELPQELFEQLRTNGINLFPFEWDDLYADCSCPDWAVPCKHLASVIYIIANEIDKNPFIVFELKGLDILKELQKMGFSSKGEFKIAITKQKDLWVKTETAEEIFVFKPVLIEQMDFSTIPESREQLLRLLAENPPFFSSGNFKTLVEKAYKGIARHYKKIQIVDADENNRFFEENVGGLILSLDEFLKYSLTEIDTGSKKQFVEGTAQNLKKLIALLENVQPSHFSLYHPTVVALYLHYRFALYLGQHSAFIPELIELKKETYQIRWIPALLIQEVKAIFETLVTLTPPKMVQVQLSARSVKTLSAEEQSKMLMAVFLNEFQVNQFYASPSHPPNYEAVGGLFFKQIPFRSKGFQTKETPQAIQKWVQKFYLTEKEFTPLLKIEEVEDQYNDVLHFEVSFWLQNRKDSLAKMVSVNNLFKQKKYAEIRLEVIQDLALLSEYLPQTKRIIQTKGEEQVQVDGEALVPILLESLPALRLLNIEILLPKSLQKLARPQLSGRVQAEGSSGASKSFVNLSNMLEFQWQVAIGDSMVSPDEFRKMVRKLKGIVKINDEYVLIDQKEMESLLKKLENPPSLKENELVRMALSQDYQGAKVDLDKKAMELISSIIEFGSISTPETLQAKLRPYQQRGYEWLYKNGQLGFGSLLADDMGLGKTIQIITLLLKLQEEGKLEKQKALIVVPTTLLGNWQKEVAKFAPTLTVSLYHGTNRNLELDHDVILTSYGIARSDEKILSKLKWAFLAIDEAQNIKNTSTAQTKSIKKLKSAQVVAMSGTPVENRLSEYWSIFDFTNKGYLNSLAKFKEEFIKPIELEQSREHLERFRKVTAPFIMRRLKTDKSIISDLPDKIETDQICSLTKEQSALYQNVVEMIMKELKDSEGIQRKGLVFQLMNALKQICNHPQQYLKKKEIDPEKSGKTQMLISLLDNIYESGEKTLIFTQYKEMGDLLAKLIQERYHTPPLWLHGGVSRKKRDAMVEDFQTKPYVKTMLLSLKAGGTGLNLTKANNVIHYDLWWNPAVENQATDRAYRIGQQNNVMVYRFITQGTFEEKINEMIKSKKELAELTVASEEQWIGDLSNDDLQSVFGLG